MKFQFKWLYLTIILTIFIWVLIVLIHNNNLNNQRQLELARKIPTLCVVVCGDRSGEALNMLKSALIFNRHRKERLKFVIVCEASLTATFDEKLSEWQEFGLNFDFEIHHLRFPETNRQQWKKLFKPCAAQRLFLPDILTHLDSILYLDSDTLFLSSPSEIWSYFDHFNATQIAAMSPEHEDQNAGWYNRFARHPYFPPLGVNSGVMLMNLTRMRAFNWTAKILPIFDEYKMKLVWGDQDLLNILFHFHADKLHLFPCDYNYRADHCMYMSVCTVPEGIRILHGNRGYFHSLAQPIFSYVYQAIQEYQFDMSTQRIVKHIEANLAIPDRNTNCDKLFEKFLFNLKLLNVKKVQSVSGGVLQ